MDEQQLVQQALKARAHAHCPYSGYAVGAALLCEDGRVFTGANVENASFGLTVCAERVAVFKAVSEGVTAFRSLAVVCGHGACVPCGACRQVLWEFSPELDVIMANADGAVGLRAKLRALLPHAFGPRELGA